MVKHLIPKAAMPFSIRQVEHLCEIARRAGCEIETWDYWYSAGCRKPGDKKALIISEVYRAERDGYYGGKIITRSLLGEWILK